MLKPQGMYFTRFLKNVYLAFFNRTFEGKKKKEITVISTFFAVDLPVPLP